MEIIKRNVDDTLSVSTVQTVEKTLLEFFGSCNTIEIEKLVKSSTNNDHVEVEVKDSNLSEYKGVINVKNGNVVSWEDKTN